jgi:hypothetical protein
MNNIDYGQLKNELKVIVSRNYENYVKNNDIKEICGISLFSDEEAMSISIAINTKEHLNSSIKDSPEYPLDFKYNPEEWKDIIENEELNEYNKLLENIYFKLKKKQHKNHIENIYKISMEILEELKDEKYFDDIPNDCVILFSISSFDFPDYVIKNNKNINSKIISKEYEQWANDMDEEYDDEE